MSLNRLISWLTDNEPALSAIAALALIAVISYVAIRYVLVPFFRYIIRQRTNSASDQSRSLRGQAKIHSPQNRPVRDAHFSLSVLLFETLSNHEDDQYLASGITAEVITYVTMIPNIRVSSHLTAYQFQTGRADIQKIAQQLNTRFVLTGSLQHANERIRVIAQLTDTYEDTEVWGQSYDRRLEDLFAVQRDIAKCIVGAVFGEVKLAEGLVAQDIPTVQLDAWGLMQKAYTFWLTTFSTQGILDACNYLRRAIEIAPEYASAKATLAMLLVQQMATRICENYDNCAEEADQLMEDSYLQAPNDIDVLENAGLVWFHLGQGQRAIAALRQTIKVAPLNLISRGYLALPLALWGGEQGATEGIELLEDNFATAPNHPSGPYWNFFRSVCEQRLGNHPAAAELARKSLIGQPGWTSNHFVIANSQCINNEPDAAKKTIKQALAINPSLTAQLYCDHLRKVAINEIEADLFIGGLKKFQIVE